MTINVLGTPYSLMVKKYSDDEVFDRKRICGYCDYHAKEIVICDMHTYKEWEHESEKTISNAQKSIVRHEIVHAFLDESGLCENSNSFDGAWATNEEMVDWFAVQGAKIYQAWMEADAL